MTAQSLIHIDDTFQDDWNRENLINEDEPEIKTFEESKTLEKKPTCPQVENNPTALIYFKNYVINGKYGQIQE